VLIVELTAFVLTLARQSLAVDFWTDLVRTSLFLLWIGLAGARSVRRATAGAFDGGGGWRGAGAHHRVGGPVSYARNLIGARTWSSTPGARHCSPSPRATSQSATSDRAGGDGLALRYFYVAHEWRRSVELRAAARVHALQARIRRTFCSTA